jgi:hypothetical protein
MNTPPDPRMQGYNQPTDPNGQMYAGDERTVRNAQSGNAYSQNQRQSYVDPNGNRVERQVETLEDKNQSRANIRYWITRVTYFVLGVLEVILLLRLLFHLLGANTSSSFITFLYDLSHTFVVAFNGIFNDQALGRSVFEFSTLIAMIVYALIGWGIVSLGRVMFAPIVSGSETVTTTRRRPY